MTNERKDKILPDILKTYAAQDIFNCDECALFFRCLPNKTCFKDDPCHGIKKSMERLTVLVCCNSDGSEKMPLLVTGKSKRPRRFKNVKELPIDYMANYKA